MGQLFFQKNWKAENILPKEVWLEFQRQEAGRKRGAGRIHEKEADGGRKYQ